MKLDKTTRWHITSENIFRVHGEQDCIARRAQCVEKKLESIEDQ